MSDIAKKLLPDIQELSNTLIKIIITEAIEKAPDHQAAFIMTTIQLLTDKGLLAVALDSGQDIAKLLDLHIKHLKMTGETAVEIVKRARADD